MKRVLVCGDSFGLVDYRFPGLHFSEKFRDCEVINLAQGGASNGMIQMQLHQGLQYSLTHVIFLFTSTWRVEYNIYLSGLTNAELKHCVSGDKNPNWSIPDIKAFTQNTYITSAHLRSKNAAPHVIAAFENHMKYMSTDHEIIRTYYMIMGMLDKVKLLNIPYCFNLGGFFSDYVLCKEKILTKHYLKDKLASYFDHATALNLWDYGNQSQDYTNLPWHHVSDDAIQTEFARQCEEILFGNT
jgi:hypothetical protein